MINYSSARYCQKKEKQATRKAREMFQNLSEEEKEKSHNMVVNDTKNALNMLLNFLKSKCWLSIGKSILKCGKTPRYNFQMHNFFNSNK